MTVDLESYTVVPANDWTRSSRSKTAAAFVSSALVASVLTGTTTSLYWRPDDRYTALGSTGSGTLFGRTSVSAGTGQLLTSMASHKHAAPWTDAVLSDKEEVQWLKQHSGLTWDQLGKVFGVSRRAVHMWANGARMNNSHAELLRAFAAAVRKVQTGTPTETRAALLAVGMNGYSVVDDFRRRHSSAPAWGAPFSPEVLLGVGDGEYRGSVQADA